MFGSGSDCDSNIQIFIRKLKFNQFDVSPDGYQNWRIGCEFLKSGFQSGFQPGSYHCRALCRENDRKSYKCKEKAWEKS